MTRSQWGLHDDDESQEGFAVSEAIGISRSENTLSKRKTWKDRKSEPQFALGGWGVA